MRVKLLVAAALLFLSVASEAANAGCTLGRIAELPVTMAAMQPTVEAKFNGKDIRLVADSGAFYSLISRADALELGLTLQDAPSNLHLEGVGGMAEVEMTHVQTFSVAHQEIHDVEFLVGGTAMNAVGVLGRNILAVYDTEYDLGGGVIRLFHTQGCGGGADLAYWAGDKAVTIVPLEWSSSRTPPAIVEVKINGVKLRALLNTGSSATVLSLPAARRVGIDVNGPGVASAGVSVGIGRRPARVWLAPVATFEIGGEKVANTKIGVIDDDGGLDYDMLLGADFFLSHRILVSQALGKVFITYQGGPVFDLGRQPHMAPQNQALAEIAQPTDAQGYSRRGAAYSARGDTDAAMADFDKAVAMAPRTPAYLVQRAQLRLALHRPMLAMDDIDAALALDPADVDALMLRAALRRRGGDDTAALADLDTVAKALPPEAGQHLALGEDYLGLDRFEPAVAQFDLWVRYHPDDARLGSALNGRCRARALQGVDLDRALSDCNRAVGLYPNSAEARDSRGLVRLRRGEYGRAIADYDAALKIAPEMAWSLYGRGLAELKTGQTEAGRADIVATETLAPKLAARAGKLGIAPEGAAAAASAAPVASPPTP